jgi:stage III sporulation protein AG
MDTVKQGMELIRKYKYVLAVVFAGLMLMLLPGREAQEAQLSDGEVREELSTQEALEKILTRIEGVGRVQVLLTEAQGSMTVYVNDESSTPDSLRSEPVIITGADRTQQGLVSQVIPPVYQGAVIVCQGGDLPGVRLAVVEAVCDATGLTADKITVLKMK